MRPTTRGQIFRVGTQHYVVSAFSQAGMLVVPVRLTDGIPSVGKREVRMDALRDYEESQLAPAQQRAVEEALGCVGGAA